MAQRNVIGIVPFDIRTFRQGLGLSQRELGIKIAIFMNGPGSPTVPSSRVNEWERRIRPIPNDVYFACANILVSMWETARSDKSKEICNLIDPQFASLLSPALGKALALECDYRERHDQRSREMHSKAKLVREAVQLHLEGLLRVNLQAVFSAAPT